MQAKENKKIYKYTKHYSGKLKNMLRKNYYQDKIKFFENEIRNSWKIMKEIIFELCLTILRLYALKG